MLQDKANWIKIPTVVQLPEEDLAEIISKHIPHENVAQFLKLVESKYEDWGVAEDVAKFYVKTIVDLLVDTENNQEWAEEFKSFLLEQANRL